MEFVKDVFDPGAKEINVTGVAGLERISEGQVRVTYYVRRKGEETVAVHLIWDRRQWLQAWHVWDQIREVVTFDGDDIVTPADLQGQKMH